MKLTIIIPTFNEQRTIKELVRSVQCVDFPIDHEIIIVDDASVDRTFEKGTFIRLRDKKNNIRLFKNKANRGKGYSIRQGIKRAKGDIIVIQDADQEYNPQDIPRLLKPILDGQAQVVYGSRFHQKKKPRGMAFPNWIANKILTKLTNIMYGLHLTDMETCYKVIKADILKALPLKADRFTFEPEVTALLAKNKIPIIELPIDYNGRTAKKGKKIKAKDFFFAVFALCRYFFWRSH